jgi:hypothetical protein
MKGLFLLSLVVIAPLVHAAAQTAPKTPQTPQKTKLGATLVTRAEAVTPLATGSQYTQIDFNWASGFTLTDTTLGTVVATPSTLGPTALSFAYQPAGGIPFGTSAFSLVANGYDSNGKALTSTAASVSVVVNVTALNSPTNLTGVPQ